jgi:cytochrome b
MPSRKADPFHWDALVRLTHWGVAAICIGNLWLNEAGEEW